MIQISSEGLTKFKEIEAKLEEFKSFYVLYPIFEFEKLKICLKLSLRPKNLA